MQREENEKGRESMEKGSRIIGLTEINFRPEICETDQLSLVFFMTEWSGLCQVIEPIIEEMSNQYAGRLKVGRVDVEAYGRLAEEYGILDVPTILFFKNGQVIDRISGAISRRALERKYLAL